MSDHDSMMEPVVNPLPDAEPGMDVADAGDAPATGIDEAGNLEQPSRKSELALSSGSFWNCGPGVHALDDPTPFGQENALQKLGKPPFEKTTRGRFRLLGYLATVYEHVSDELKARAQTAPPADPAGGDARDND